MKRVSECCTLTIAFAALAQPSARHSSAAGASVNLDDSPKARGTLAAWPARAIGCTGPLYDDHPDQIDSEAECGSACATQDGMSVSSPGQLANFSIVLVLAPATQAIDRGWVIYRLPRHEVPKRGHQSNRRSPHPTPRFAGCACLGRSLT